MNLSGDSRARVAMLIASGYGPDVRVQKEAHTLALAGCDVTVIAWDRRGMHPGYEIEHIPARLEAALMDWEGRIGRPPCPVTVTRVQINAGYRTGRRLLLKIPLSWWRMIGKLRRFRPNVVHAHDLDTLPVAYLYCRLTGTPVIYDAREYYPGMVRANVGTALSGVLEKLDRWLTPRTAAVLTVGERLAARYRALGGRVWIVHNAQPLPNSVQVEAEGRARRAALGVPDDALLVVYVGVLNPDRLIAPALEAVPRLDHTWLVVAGDGPQLDRVRAAAAACSRIQALGRVPLEDVMGLVAAADVVYYGLDGRDPNSRYFMPNLAFFALAVGRPLLTTPVGEVAEAVRREEWGIVMETATSAEVEASLRRLSDAGERATLAARARFFGQTQYNWRAAAEQLWDAYRTVFGTSKCQ